MRNMKRMISVFVVLSLIFSLAGCNLDESEFDKTVEIPWGEVVGELVSGHYKGCEYVLKIEENGRVVQLRCSICDENLIDRDMTLAEFSKYVQGGYTDEEIEIMLAIYKAQGIGVEMLHLLRTLEGVSAIKTENRSDDEIKKDIMDTISDFKSNLDAVFSVVEEENDNLAAFGSITSMERDELIEMWSNDKVVDTIGVGEDLEELVGYVQTAAAMYGLGQAAKENDGSAAAMQTGVAAFLGLAENLIGYVPVFGDIYSRQINALAGTCDNYFKACENYKNILALYEGDGKTASDIVGVFHVAPPNSTEIDEIAFFQHGITRDQESRRKYWSAEGMPDLMETMERLAAKWDGKTLYDRLGENDPRLQLLVTKYLEFRIHHEFEEITGISLECYYDLMKPKKGWFGGNSWKKMPWEKEIDIHSYTTYVVDKKRIDK